MAVFMINICKYNGCGITFPRLGDLIQHIEDTHIDYDPLVVEQKEASQPSCLPLSYILRYFTEEKRREYQNAQNAPEVRRRVLPAPKTPSVRSSTPPTGSELDEEEMLGVSEDSNDSWTTVEEFSSEYILRIGSRIQNSCSAATGSAVVEKPFACPVPGCKKRYKNVNGIKYHSKNGHKKDGKVKKGYKCLCGKSYKTSQKLKNHSNTRHVNSQALALATNVTPPDDRSVSSKPLQTTMPNLVVTASQPLHRPINIVEGLDGKLIRVYDTYKTKDAPFTIPKQIGNITVVNRNIDMSPIPNLGNFDLLTPNSTPGSSPIDKIKYFKEDRSPKVTVQSNPTLSPLKTIYANDKMYLPPNM